MQLSDISVVVVWRFVYQLVKSDEMATTFLSDVKVEVMNGDVQVIQGELHFSCWPAWVRSCNRNIKLLAGWPMGENERTYIYGLSANRHSNRHSKWADVGNHSFRSMMLTLIPLRVSDISVAVHCSSSISPSHILTSEALFSSPNGNV